MRQKRRLLNCGAATGVADTRIEHSAPANGEDRLNNHGPSPSGATAAECPKKEALGVAIPVEVVIAALRTALRRLCQSHSRERSVFSLVRTYSKMSLRRSSPARLPIRCLFWHVCSWKKRGDMKFVSRQKPKRRFINLARTAEYPLTGNFWSETRSGWVNATFTRSML